MPKVLFARIVAVPVMMLFLSGCTATPSTDKIMETGEKTAGHSLSPSVLEPAKRVPVAYDADVVVAGGGISGVFAALAAAREGASTVLIDRFGTVGGTLGPGMMSQEGALKDHHKQIVKGAPNDAVKGDVTALPKEFAEQFFAIAPDAPSRFLADSNKGYHVALKMLKEAGVILMLSAYACDPIIEGNTVYGVFVENKSGRQAVKAKVVIDATGEADVSRRAGGHIDYLRHLRKIIKPTGRVCVIEKYPVITTRKKKHGWSLSLLVKQAEESGWIPIRYELLTGTYH